MNKNTMMTASMMMSNEIETLSSELEEAKLSLADCDLDDNAEWTTKYNRRMQCKIIEGKIFILKKMMREIADMSIELPQLATA